MPKSFRCKVVTPAAALVDDAMVYASVPAWDGLMGVLPDRAPLLTRLGIGELRLDYADAKAEGGRRSFLVEGGFAKMADNQLTILAERAVPAEQLTAQMADEELRRAEAIQVTGTGPERQAQNEARQAAIRRAQVMKQLASGSRAI